jgi:hypothetical protein
MDIGIGLPTYMRGISLPALADSGQVDLLAEALKHRM